MIVPSKTVLVLFAPLELSSADKSIIFMKKLNRVRFKSQSYQTRARQTQARVTSWHNQYVQPLERVRPQELVGSFKARG